MLKIFDVYIRSLVNTLFELVPPLLSLFALAAVLAVLLLFVLAATLTPAFVLSPPLAELPVDFPLFADRP